MKEGQKDYIYIVVSRTNTLLGKVIRKKLSVTYNHCSLSLDDSLDCIYSFGRKTLWNMFHAGFVTESKNEGFFKIHSDANVLVIRMEVTSETRVQMIKIIQEFESRKDELQYSALGLVYCTFGIARKRENKYFCSQFVAEVLEKAGLEVFEKPSTLVCPHDFLLVEGTDYVYEGCIGNYCAA